MEPGEVDQALHGRIAARLGNVLPASLGQQAFHLSLSLHQGCLLLVPVMYTVGGEAPKDAAWASAALQGLFRELGHSSQLVRGSGTSAMPCGISSSSNALVAGVEGQRLHLALSVSAAPEDLLPVASLAGLGPIQLEVLAATGGGWVVSVPRRLPEGSVLHVAVGLAEEAKGGISQASCSAEGGTREELLLSEPSCANTNSSTPGASGSPAGAAGARQGGGGRAASGDGGKDDPIIPITLVHP